MKFEEVKRRDRSRKIIFGTPTDRRYPRRGRDLMYIPTTIPQLRNRTHILTRFHSPSITYIYLHTFIYLQSHSFTFNYLQSHSISFIHLHLPPISSPSIYLQSPTFHSPHLHLPPISFIHLHLSSNHPHPPIFIYLQSHSFTFNYLQ